MVFNTGAALLDAIVLAVVSKETYNGLVRYDRIVKNADKVSEQDILY